MELRAQLRRHAGALLLLPFAALLVGVIATVYSHFDGTHGFDYGGHLDYVRFVDFTVHIPLATRGWQMYHPPAYYAATAVFFEALHRLGGTLTMTDAGRWLATAAWILQGVVAAAAVRAWYGSWLGAAAAGAIVWLLPGQSMMGSMLYNETLTGLGVGIIVLGVAIWSRSTRWGLALIAVGVPVAALSNHAGLAAAVVAGLFVLWRARHRLWPALLALAPGTLATSIFYLRNLYRLGTPLPLNEVIFHLKDWDPYGWGQPAGYFTRVELKDCSASVSFIGGFWKWFFATDCFDLAPWRSTLSPVLLVAALLLTVVVLGALVWLLLHWSADSSQLLLIAIPAIIVLAFVFYVVGIPSPSSDKGVYTLADIVPLAVVVGLFLSQLTKGRSSSTVAFVVLLGWSLVMANASGLG